MQWRMGRESGSVRKSLCYTRLEIILRGSEIKMKGLRRKDELSVRDKRLRRPVRGLF